MATPYNLNESATYDAAVPSLDIASDVRGAPNSGTPNQGDGNAPHVALANRTKYLKAFVDYLQIQDFEQQLVSSFNKVSGQFAFQKELYYPPTTVDIIESQHGNLTSGLLYLRLPNAFVRKPSNYNKLNYSFVAHATNTIFDGTRVALTGIDGVYFHVTKWLTQKEQTSILYRSVVTSELATGGWRTGQIDLTATPNGTFIHAVVFGKIGNIATFPDNTHLYMDKLKLFWSV